MLTVENDYYWKIKNNTRYDEKKNIDNCRSIDDGSHSFHGSDLHG